MLKQYDLVVVGAGSAGMAAATEAKKQGVESILIIERDKELGGILNQCIHNGFGIHHFKELLTGPEYSSRVIQEAKENNIDFIVNTMVLKVDENKMVHAINSTEGYIKIQARAVVLAMGCRERTRGAINIQGARPAGIFTAGTAQRLVNLDGYLPGKKVVVLGSGDIGLIMARRMTLEGAQVEAVVEIMPRSNGLQRNVVQCLDDFDIPLLLSHTVVRIHGRKRVEGVTIAKVDAQLKPIEGTERFITCDTLLLSVGLIPENEITRNANIEIDDQTRGAVVDEFRQTSKEGIFACGNVLHVHDLVDFVSAEGKICGEGVARYLSGSLNLCSTHRAKNGEGISYVTPQRICSDNIDNKVKIYFRVRDVFDHHMIEARIGDQVIAKKRSTKFLPAEMLSIDIKKDDLLKHAGEEIHVSVKPLD